MTGNSPHKSIADIFPIFNFVKTGSYSLLSRKHFNILRLTDVLNRLGAVIRTSQRKAAAQLDFSRSSLQNCLRKLNMKPFRPRLLQALSEDDFDRRVEFCEMFAIRSTADPSFPDIILWTDEATFKLKRYG